MLQLEQLEELRFREKNQKARREAKSARGVKAGTVEVERAWARVCVAFGCVCDLVC